MFKMGLFCLGHISSECSSERVHMVLEYRIVFNQKDKNVKTRAFIKSVIKQLNPRVGNKLTNLPHLIRYKILCLNLM